MSKQYKHLSRDERIVIAALRERDLSIREIARQLGRQASTVSREVRRNRSSRHGGKYVGFQAQRRYDRRWRERHRRPRLKSPELRAYIRKRLKQHWSPEQISGRLRHDGSAMRVSHEAIYQWIYQEARDLILCLTRAHPKRVRPGYRKYKRIRIRSRVPIHKRPVAVAARQEAGHWEVDTVSWRHGNAALLVAAERKTRLTRLKPLPGRQALALSKALIEALRIYPSKMRQTMTYDNGPENVLHVRVNRALGTRSYFCDPYQSWQKGTVENSNGLIRWYFPRSMHFGVVTKREVKKVERLLNSRPRKCLNYQTPAEAFKAECCT